MKPKKQAKHVTLTHTLHIAGEFLGGIIAGIILGIIGLLVGMTIGGNSPYVPPIGSLVGYEAGGVIGAIIGLALGASLGVYAIGKLLKEHGLYWSTFLASVVAMFLDLAIYDYSMPTSVLYLLLLLPPVAAVIGFQTTLHAT